MNSVLHVWVPCLKLTRITEFGLELLFENHLFAIHEPYSVVSSQILVALPLRQIEGTKTVVSSGLRRDGRGENVKLFYLLRFFGWVSEVSWSFSGNCFGIFY